MRQYKRKTVPKYMLKVVVCVDDVGEYMEDGERITLKKPSIKSKRLLDDQYVQELEDLLNDVLYIFKKYDFIIHNDDVRQSRQSYSYYFEVTPTNKDGDPWEYPVVLQVEIREHTQPGRPLDDIIADKGKKYIKCFYVVNNKVFSIKGVLSRVETLCKQLKNGNYSSLKKLKR